MSIPVLIAARNEANSIGQTLKSLPKDVEPIVLVNDSHDETVDIAQSYGATVLERQQAGKVGALQMGLHYLGERAVDPFITLDADTRPVFPNRWVASLLAGRQAIPAEQPASVVGLLVFHSNSSALLRTSRLVLHQYLTRTSQQAGSFSGGNMLIHPRQTSVVQAIGKMPEYWPGEDVAIKDEIVNGGGSVIKTLSVGAVALTDGSRMPSLSKTIINGRQHVRDYMRESYLSDAPAGSRPYSSPTEQQPTPTNIVR